MRGEKKEKVRRRRRAPRDDLRERTEKVAQVVSHVNEMAEQKIDRSDLTAVTWFCPCRFAASLAAFAALAWLVFTLLFFGGILQVTSGSTGPPCVAGVTSHTVATQLRLTVSRRQSNRTPLSASMAARERHDCLLRHLRDDLGVRPRQR